MVWVGGNALAPNRRNLVPRTVMTFRQGSCNQRVGCLQWLGFRAFGPAKWSSPRLLSTVPWRMNRMKRWYACNNIVGANIRENDKQTITWGTLHSTTRGTILNIGNGPINICFCCLFSIGKGWNSPVKFKQLQDRAPQGKKHPSLIFFCWKWRGGGL